MLQANFFNQAFVFPILNLLTFFYKLFLVVGLPGAFGFSIVALTVFVRFLVNPFFKQQLETSKKMADIKPQLDKLSLKYKKEPQKLQQEQMNLYKQAGINPAAGCLFMIVQFPIFIGLYQTLSLLLTNGQGGKVINSINKVLYFPFLNVAKIDPWFLGFNLGLTPAKAKLWYYYLVPVVTGLLQYLQTQATMPAMMPATPAPTKEIAKTDDPNKKKEATTGGDFQKAMNTQMKYFFPVMIAWFSYTLPVGLALYWNIFSLFSIIQYRQIKKK
ncbi:hypothetical protein AUJ29_03460 [Candidatus Kuenenbacteria bacterium CG1_02_38_13]|uniref:Membrane insertase YidC/Oxa/ALB C-terminal domain-containing protein n=1 Tax=Candidatus Kuenenbacteria bacterium CG1_02_38_13 TaxID=1805235 RepID=A0A1J4TUB3_9BACT|nr:MAG: hypothetical protein AUJ29_03460 [Candidatus Kuenenbacteria bacterium CG1_02_38_13]